LGFSYELDLDRDLIVDDSLSILDEVIPSNNSTNKNSHPE